MTVPTPAGQACRLVPQLWEDADHPSWCATHDTAAGHCPEQAAADRGEADPIERVARAIWEAGDGYIACIPWDRAGGFRRAKAVRQAAAAVEVLRGEGR